MDELSLEEKLRRLEVVLATGVALAAEHDRSKLLESILLEAQQLCRADGGTLYLYEPAEGGEVLRFAIVRNDALGLALGGTTGRPIALPPVPMRDAEGRPNHANVASHAAWVRATVNVPDVRRAEGGFDFTGVKRFDAQTGHTSISFLTIPLQGSKRQLIGVLQLINARDPSSGAIRAFPSEDQRIVEALAAQAGVILDNQLLLEEQRRLLESFIRLIAEAIDAKSPYTGGHCERVPVLAELLTRAACDAQDGPLAQFRLDTEGWYELRIAAWLHDCGKVVTPVHVMDKATKLEAIADRIEVVRERFAVLEREAELDFLRGERDMAAQQRLAQQRARLAEDLAFLERVNRGGEFLGDAERERIRSIGARPYPAPGAELTLLSEQEIALLGISRGTLSAEERLTINAHMVHTIQMLEALPFPANLARVPEYATGHHETMDGRGYPRGLYAGEMSIPARILAIADVFEALTAQDRPYKPGKKLSEAMAIMGAMKRDNHLDPDLLDLFVRSGVYRDYAQRYLPPDLIDAVDEAALLAIEPQPFELPPPTERAQRRSGLLPHYEALRKPLGRERA